MNLNIEGILGRLGIGRDAKVGLALSGGGARGFAHIGVLMAFERFGVKPDIMSGVSAGAIAGVLYGAGLSPEDIMQCFTDASKLGDFTELALPKQGLMKLDKFGKLLEKWLPVSRLEDLNIPVVVCATDMDKGKSVGWAKGDIVPRVLASCSIPVVFRPMTINGAHYVDGGVLRNLPAWAIRKNCTKLFGSNCSPLRQEDIKSHGIAEIAYRTFHLMLKANIPQDIRLCDYVINVHSVTGVNTFELSSLRKGVIAGYEAASRVLEGIM